MPPVSALPSWETRTIGIEGRAELSEDRRIRGYAIVFHRKSLDLGGFKEIILPEAVDRTLRENLDVRAYFDHDSSKVLGRTRAGTLRLDKDPHGLRVEISPPNTTLAKDIIVSIKRGDITGMSFRFQTITDDWHMEDGLPIREVSDMIIGEVSVVSEPAYEDTAVAVRSLQGYRQAPIGREIAYLQRKIRAGAR